MLLGTQYWAADRYDGYSLIVCVGTDWGLGCCGIDGIVAGSCYWGDCSWRECVGHCWRVSVDGTDEGLYFGDDTLDDFFGEVCKDGEAVAKGMWLVSEICIIDLLLL